MISSHRRRRRRDGINEIVHGTKKLIIIITILLDVSTTYLFFVYVFLCMSHFDSLFVAFHKQQQHDQKITIILVNNNKK